MPGGVIDTGQNGQQVTRLLSVWVYIYYYIYYKIYLSSCKVTSTEPSLPSDIL